jgi:hypothetical protein
MLATLFFNLTVHSFIITHVHIIRKNLAVPVIYLLYNVEAVWTIVHASSFIGIYDNDVA